MKKSLYLYAIKNEKEQWFRSKGGSSCFPGWVEDFTKARIYQKIGPARGVITFFANNYKGYKTPKLVKLLISEIIEVDETERVKKQQHKKEAQEAINRLSRK